LIVGDAGRVFGVVEIQGIERFERWLRSYRSRAMTSVAEAYAAAFDRALDAAGDRTPEKRGSLKRSRWRGSPTVLGDRFDVLGGYSAGHAWVNHEIDRPHPRGRWKFLSSAIDEAAPGMALRVAEDAGRALASGGEFRASPRYPGSPGVVA